MWVQRQIIFSHQGAFQDSAVSFVEDVAETYAANSKRVGAQALGKERRGFESSQPDEILLIGEFNLQRISLAGLNQHAPGCPECWKLFADFLKSDGEARGRKVQQRKLLAFHVGPDFAEDTSKRRQFQKEDFIQSIGWGSRTVQQKRHPFLAGRPALQLAVDAGVKQARSRR